MSLTPSDQDEIDALFGGGPDDEHSALENFEPEDELETPEEVRDEWGMLPADYDRDEIGDTTSGRMRGITRMKRVLTSLQAKKEDDEIVAAQIAAEEAERAEVEAKAKALEHYEENGWGGFG